MKTLPFHPTENRNDVLVDCADGPVSVYRKCADCIHCTGVRVGKRVMPSPMRQKMELVKKGAAPDEDLLNARIMYNTLIRDGSAVECDDDGNEGFHSFYRY
ncbi:MAG: hypothetical protein GKC04_07885 [Methanomicrobiales archaeon]|nr:hypothetical protein [Methanomicrobiales archaeon]